MKSPKNILIKSVLVSRDVFPAAALVRRRPQQLSDLRQQFKQVFIKPNFPNPINSQFFNYVQKSREQSFRCYQSSRMGGTLDKDLTYSLCKSADNRISSSRKKSRPFGDLLQL